jgi:hypothetical protein
VAIEEEGNMSMKLNRLLVLTGLVLFAAGVSRAGGAPLPQPTFTIDLNDIFGTDGGGWGSSHDFTVQVNPSDVTGTFYGSPICTELNGSGYAYVAYYGEECSTDASVHVNYGGDAPPVPGSLFTIETDEAGGGFNTYTNDGPGAITSLLITATYPSSFFAGNSFECDTTAFLSCVIGVTDPDAQISFYLSGGPGIPAAVPEPSYVAVFLAASGLLIWTLKARRSKRV